MIILFIIVGGGAWLLADGKMRRAARERAAAAQAIFGFCPRCGVRVVGGTRFCPCCGTNLGALAGASPVAPVSEEGSFGVAFVSFLFPVIGFILWLAYKPSAPGRSRSALHGMLWGVLVLIILAYFATISLAGAR